MESTQTYYQFSDLVSSKSFLGKEFLTWLWYFIEEEGGDFSFQNDSTKSMGAEIWIDDKIAFESTGSDTARHSLNGGNPSDSLEATAALLTGKIVTELKLGLTIGEDQYRFGLASKDLTPKSVTIPKPPLSGDPASTAIFRLSHIEKVITALDTIFIQFLQARVDDSWEDESLINLRNWISQRKEENRSLH